MYTIIGTCGHCGGAVCIPTVWLSVEPPVPRCNSCGRTPKEAHGPIIPMNDNPHKGYKKGD
jgi:hypothetical protein